MGPAQGVAAAGGRGRRLVLKEEAPKGLEEQHYSRTLLTEWSYHNPTAALGHIHVCMHACMHVCMYIHIHIHMHIHIHIYIYIYIYMYTYICMVLKVGYVG